MSCIPSGNRHNALSSDEPFFFTKHNKKGDRITQPSDIVAVDYFPVPTDWPYTSNDLSPYLKTNKPRMDGALAHLSFARLDWGGHRKEWSADQLRAEIGAKWFEFVGQLQIHNKPAATRFVGIRSPKTPCRGW